MDKKRRKKLGLAIGSAAVALAAVIGALCFLQYRVYLPYYWERLTAPRSASPQAAYDGFYKALAEGRTRAAMRYLSREERAAFKHRIKEEPELIERQIGQKSLLHELYVEECDDRAICKKFAVYGYEYEVKEGYAETVNGQEFFVAPGVRNLQMRFIQLPGGAWQISQL